MSKSKLGKLNFRDLGRGFLTAFAGAVIIALYAIVDGGKIPTEPETLYEIFRTGLAAGLGYIVMNLGTNSKGQFLAKDSK